MFSKYYGRLLEHRRYEACDVPSLPTVCVIVSLFLQVQVRDAKLVINTCKFY